MVGMEGVMVSGGGEARVIVTVGRTVKRRKWEGGMGFDSQKREKWFEWGRDGGEKARTGRKPREELEERIKGHMRNC